MRDTADPVERTMAMIRAGDIRRAQDVADDLSRNGRRDDLERLFVALVHYFIDRGVSEPRILEMVRAFSQVH